MTVNQSITKENEQVTTDQPESAVGGRTAGGPHGLKSFRRVAGQTTVEFILVILPLLALIFLAIQLCLIWSAESMVQVAAYSAARKYAVCGDYNSAFQVAMLYLQPFAKNEDVTLSIGTSPGYGVLGAPTAPTSPLELGETFYTQLAVVYTVLPFPIVQQFFFDSFPQQTVEGPFHTQGSSPPNGETLGVSPPDTVVINNTTTVQPPTTQTEVDLNYENWRDWKPLSNTLEGTVDLGSGWTNNSNPDLNNVIATVGWPGWGGENKNDNNDAFNEILWFGVPGDATWFFDQLGFTVLGKKQSPGLYDYTYSIIHWYVASKMDGKITMYAGSVMTYESNGD